MTAEEAPIGSYLVWSDAPQVKPPIGQLPFVAPSINGRKMGMLDGNALVRFQFVTPLGRTVFSDPIEVLPGQSCVVTEQRG